jgi:hypothetical protein
MPRDVSRSGARTGKERQPGDERKYRVERRTARPSGAIPRLPVTCHALYAPSSAPSYFMLVKSTVACSRRTCSRMEHARG